MAVRTATNGRKGTAVGERQKNDAASIIDLDRPYRARIAIEGTAAMLFHRWSNEAVEAKSKAAKGSAAKKTDDVETYVYRNTKGIICLPGDYLRGAICGPNGAAKLRQDPRSPRKSALDLYKAGVVVETELAPLGKANWDYLDCRRVMIQRNAITRVRPAFLAGWKAIFDITVLLPQYIAPADLRAVLIDAGKFVGLADYRPTYGRFDTTSFKVL